jgi:hypothetical protein
MKHASMTMNKPWLAAVWFCGGGALGQLANTILFPLWSKTGLLLPIGHWLDGHGGKAFVWFWFILWLNIASWSLAAVIGVLIGLFTGHRLLLNLVLFGLGFAVVPLALFAYLDSTIPSAGNITQGAVAIALVLLGGLLSHRLAYREKEAAPERSAVQP